MGGYEIYRKFDNTSSLIIERTTVHVSDDTGRIAMLEKRTVGNAIDDNNTAAALTRYIYSNHLQSASLELDENADIISYEEYHPYGTTSYQAMNASINAVAKRYRYTGKERDEESGLYYHGARYYIPWLCRWSASDPLESEYSPKSPYVYCSNSPISRTDENGKSDNNKVDLSNQSEEVKKHITDKENLTLYIFQDKNTLEDKSTKLNDIANEVKDIFNSNGVVINVIAVDNTNGEGDSLYSAWKRGELPINQAVLKITDDETQHRNPGSTGPWFIRGKGDDFALMTWDINAAKNAKNDSLAFEFLPTTDLTFTQLHSTGIAHESLHYFLSAFAYHFGFDKQRKGEKKSMAATLFNFTGERGNANSKGYSHHEKLEGEIAHLNSPGENLRAITTKNISQYRRILPEQIVAMNIFSDDLKNLNKINTETSFSTKESDVLKKYNIYMKIIQVRINREKP